MFYSRVPSSHGFGIDYNGFLGWTCSGGGHGFGCGSGYGIGDGSGYFIANNGRHPRHTPITLGTKHALRLEAEKVIKLRRPVHHRPISGFHCGDGDGTGIGSGAGLDNETGTFLVNVFIMGDKIIPIEVSMEKFHH